MIIESYQVKLDYEILRYLYDGIVKFVLRLQLRVDQAGETGILETEPSECCGMTVKPDRFRLGQPGMRLAGCSPGKA